MHQTQVVISVNEAHHQTEMLPTGKELISSINESVHNGVQPHGVNSLQESGLVRFSI